MQSASNVKARWMSCGCQRSNVHLAATCGGLLVRLNRSLIVATMKSPRPLGRSGGGATTVVASCGIALELSDETSNTNAAPARQHVSVRLPRAQCCTALVSSSLAANSMSPIRATSPKHDDACRRTHRRPVAIELRSEVSTFAAGWSADIDRDIGLKYPCRNGFNHSFDRRRCNIVSEAATFVVPLVLEASVFITVTWFVGRPRPNVARLEGSPVDSSFPSGHVAAAVVYSAMVIVVFWHTRNRIVRSLAVLLAVSVTFIVGYARIYRGMHYLSDVLAGALLGAVAVASSWWILRSIAARDSDPTQSASPATVAEVQEAV